MCLRKVVVHVLLPHASFMLHSLAAKLLAQRSGIEFHTQPTLCGRLYNAARSLAESTQCSLYHFVHIRVGSVRIVFTHYRRHGVFNTRFLLRCPTRAVGDSQHFAVPFSADLMLN